MDTTTSAALPTYAPGATRHWLWRVFSMVEVIGKGWESDYDAAERAAWRAYNYWKAVKEANADKFPKIIVAQEE